VKHGTGGHYRHDCKTKAANASEVTRGSMRSHHRHGRDYTPLFRFLISHAGDRWNDAYPEAKERLDTVGPIFWLVARTENERMGYVRVGESSFSGMFVDDEGILCLVKLELRAEDMQSSCTCCTHTLNGIRFGTAI
jgi:hypothetical protein